MYQLNPLRESLVKDQKTIVLHEEAHVIGALSVAYLVIGKIAASIGDHRKVKALYKIIEAYPNPNTLFKKLKSNSKTVKLSESLQQSVNLQSWSGNEDDYYQYASWILTNILHYFGILKYLATILGGPISLAYQIMKSAATKNYTADRIIFGKNPKFDLNDNNTISKTTKGSLIKKYSTPKELLILGVTYITLYCEKDPILIKEYKEYKESGLAMFGNYDNLIMCCSTCANHISKGVSYDIIATQSKSGKRIVSWTKSQLKTNKLLIDFAFKNK